VVLTSPGETSLPRWIHHEVEEGIDVLYLNGVWRLPNLAAISNALRALLAL